MSQLTEIAKLWSMIDELRADKADLRERVAKANEQILALSAASEKQSKAALAVQNRLDLATQTLDGLLEHLYYDQQDQRWKIAEPATDSLFRKLLDDVRAGRLVPKNRKPSA